MESMAAGTPVITSSNPDFRKIVNELEIGVCATHISSTAIALCLRSLTSDPVSRNRMAHNGTRCHEDTYPFEAQFRAVLEAFRPIAGPTRK